MTEEPSTESSEDKCAYVQERFLALALELRAEGLKPITICNAAHAALWDGSFQTPMELLVWLAVVEENAVEDRDTIEKIILDNN